MIRRDVLSVVAITTAVASGLAGGVFFSFSTFVMSGLRRLPPAQGIATMQSINKQAPTPAFMTLLFGTAVLSAGLGVHALAHRDEPQAAWMAGGATSYLVAIAMTAAFHVPRNEKLAAFDGSTPEAARYWATYLTEWTGGNHVRTVACALAAALFVVSARRLP